MQVTNRSQNPLELLMRYPERVGVNFEVLNRPNKRDQNEINLENDGTYTTELYRPIRSTIKLMPQESATKLIALQRYLAIQGPGKYSIQYNVFIREKQKSKNHHPQDFESKGHFEIEVAEGGKELEFTEALVERFWDAGSDMRGELMELLRFADDPTVIGCLLYYGFASPKQARLHIEGLQKFAERPAVRSAMVALAARGTEKAVQGLVRFFQEEGYKLTKAEASIFLCSTSDQKVFLCLEYLQKHLELAQKLRVEIQRISASQESEIAKLSRQLLEEIEDGDGTNPVGHGD